jgi:hypothetical protein
MFSERHADHSTTTATLAVEQLRLHNAAVDFNVNPSATIRLGAKIDHKRPASVHIRLDRKFPNAITGGHARTGLSE